MSITKSGHDILWVVTIIMLLSSLVFYIAAARLPKKNRAFRQFLTLFLSSHTHVVYRLLDWIHYHDCIHFLHVRFYLHFLAKTAPLKLLHRYMAVGGSAQLVKARGHYNYREVLTARYIDWLFTTPFLLADLGLFAGLSPMDIGVLIVFDIFMIGTYTLSRKNQVS